MYEQQMNNENQQKPEPVAVEVKEDVSGVKPEAKKEPPKKKELTPAELQKRKKMIVMPLFFLIFAGAIWLIFAPSGKDEEQIEGQSGLNAELPLPKDEIIVEDKRKAYEQEAMREREEIKMRSLQDLSDMFSEQSGEADWEEYEDSGLNGRSNARSPGISLSSSADAYQDVNRQLGAWYEQPAVEMDEQAQLAIEWRIQELERKLEEAEERQVTEDQQTALLEKSYQLAAKYMPGAMQQPDENNVPVSVSSAKDKVAVQLVRQVRENVVSLLSAPMEDDEFIDAFSQPRNLGFYTAAGNETMTDKNSIRACVCRTVTLSSGKELQIRLLEPMRAGNILIPANTVVTGVCRIGGERMEVTVHSIQYAGNIIPVELQVYDMDGQPGISVPGSDEINAVKEVTGQLAQSAGTSITITDNAGSQLASDLGRGLMQGASQYVNKKISVVKVTLKANYQLLLLPMT